MNETLIVWVLTVSIWSEQGTRVAYTHEFKKIAECMAVAEEQIRNFETDPKHNKQEHMQASCVPKQ